MFVCRALLPIIMKVSFACLSLHVLLVHMHGYPAALLLRNTRKKLSKRPVERETIKTVSKYDLQRARRKREMVEGSKRRRDSGH